MSRTIALAALLISVGCASAAPPRPDFPKPRNEAELDARLRFLEQRLAAGQLHAAAWSGVWLGIQVFSGISQIEDAAAARQSGDRSRDIVNAVKSTVGVADVLVIRPMPGREGAAPLRAMPEGTEDERLARLARGEEILLATADRAAARRSWKVHVGNVLFNLAGSAVLLGLGHADAAATTLETGVVGGELQIWTEPWRGTHDLADYEHLVQTGHVSAPGAGQHWLLAPARDGLALQMRF
jgi:hypothetical protein